MTYPPTRQTPAVYHLWIAGNLDHHWSIWFGDLTLPHESDGTTAR